MNMKTDKKKKTAEEYASGLGLSRENFSDADWKLYDTDRRRFESIAGYKSAYQNVGSSQERNKINTAAERLREEAGYTGGPDGKGYYMTTANPGAFSYEDREDFSYNSQEDPLYQAYKKQYMREGRRAAQDAMGIAASATGGIPSSYAATAAAQAGNLHAARLGDKLPELYQAAYSRYMDETGQYNQDRNFAYGQYMDGIDYSSKLYDRSWQEAADMAAVGDYSGYEGLGVGTENNPMLLRQQNQALQQEERDREYTLSKAKLALESGDYDSVYNLLGIRVNSRNTQTAELLKAALFKAELGDYSWLNQLVGGMMQG